MLDYDFTKRAVRDITSAREWYDRHEPDLGNRFVDAVLRAIREAREHPEQFPEMEPGVRGIGCVGFPYRVYCELRPDKIVVRAVYHGARDPSRWDDENRN
jgi:plasmid stabilization system protein ParE